MALRREDRRFEVCRAAVQGIVIGSEPTLKKPVTNTVGFKVFLGALQALVVARNTKRH